ncbi:hypothetical protein [Mycolicibacterium sp. CBMA 361]|uniref:hypothetical protein n=1 Tax=Mycolicibacterium sp. CBMA 361 TaxID=2606610 RepID=UPI0012DC6A1B|nr:hypothetical protein [Mycolicibacterium sp. CBMA 361]MUM35628.1 hypothetical protein [Mycolicibacterium sp. CBMA 361]
MAAAFDVDARLADGERALTALDSYVAASAVLGLPYPGASLVQLYGAEGGLDLAALATDARSLDAASRWRWGHRQRDRRSTGEAIRDPGDLWRAVARATGGIRCCCGSL